MTGQNAIERRLFSNVPLTCMREKTDYCKRYVTFVAIGVVSATTMETSVRLSSLPAFNSKINSYCTLQVQSSTSAHHPPNLTPVSNTNKWYYISQSRSLRYKYRLSILRVAIKYTTIHSMTIRSRYRQAG